MFADMKKQVRKSEILFLYETSYNIPNGDPFTGEQRCDEETKKILVSDVRIKRFIRDYLASKGNLFIYIEKRELPDQGEEPNTLEVAEAEETVPQKKKKGKTQSGSARRIDELTSHFKAEIDKLQLNKGSVEEALFAMKKCIDVRLFGGISTKTHAAVNLTGPVQFALLNPSLNRVDMRVHQNTSCLESNQEKNQGAMAMTTLVPYSLVQIHGWINSKVAEQTDLTDDDLKLMFEGLWHGVGGEGSSHTRSKVGQNSLLFLNIIYKDTKQKLYDVDRLVRLIPKGEKKEEQIRNREDYELDFSRLVEVVNSDKVESVEFFTEIESIEKKLSALFEKSSKIRKMERL
jgi:CRISPR-associated protein Csh2